MRRYRVRLFFGATLLLALSVVFLWEPVPPMLLALTRGAYFLHSTSSNDFLNNTPPTASTAQFKDSPSVTRTGFKEIGTWYAAPADTAVTLTALQDLHVWLGLKNSDDQGTFFDLRAELRKNNTTIAAGVTPNIQGVTRNPSQAKEVTVAFGSISDKDKQCAPGDILSLKILVKVANSGGHSNAVGVRLYYDAVSQQSRFWATLNTPPVADAGLPQTVAVGTTVTLDGSQSHDVDGDTLTFSWAITTAPAGSLAALSDPAAVQPTFGVDEPGMYTVQLLVKDATLTSTPATVVISTLNSPPVANAGLPQTVAVGTTVTLDGSQSHDVDGDTLTFSWAITTAPAGSLAALSDPAAVQPTFGVDEPGMYTVQLLVKDATLTSTPATVVISTLNSPPVANAGLPQTVAVGTTVTLDGSQSHDVDGDTLTFSWAITTAPAGSLAALSDPAAVQPTFGVDEPGMYTVQLLVKDATLTSTPATVVISTLNSPPVANAGLPQTVAVGTTVTLDGSQSHDVDGDTLTFSWAITTAPAGSLAALSDPAAVQPTFGVDKPGMYTVQLLVKDATLTSTPATVVISTQNSPPVANAGLPQTIAVGTTVTLDGSQSHDVDGDTLTFSWALTYVPTGSAATLAAPTALHPTFGVDKPGTYVAQLIVNDGTVDSVPATVIITANTPPPPPLNAGQITLSEITNGFVTVTGAPGAGVAGTTVTVTNARAGKNATGTVQANGSFTLQIAAQGGDTLSLVVTDATGQSSPATTVTVGSALPPDPAMVASSLDRSVATDIATATAFLYTNSPPIQTGVAPDTIVPRRAAVLRGTVLDHSGAPLPGVAIAILNHPEFGQTLSRADGMFDLAVNGGGQLTVTYSKAGLLSAQRQLMVPWQDYAFLPDVVLIAADPQVTTINLTATTPIQVARGSVQSDTDGTRQATLLFRQGTQAQLRFADGSTQPLSTLSVRATEYTVGPNGPKAMPAELPPTSAYTYAVELSADEATALGATSVDFSQPVLHYMENFLGFPVGGIVPVGFYDRQVGMWIPSDNGRIIKVLSITSGLANLDIDGNGQAASSASLATLGITDAERQSLASLYTPGQQLWRLPIPHFSPGDGNHPFAPFSGTLSAKDEPPNQLPPQPNNPLDRSCHSVGSVIECQNQILGEVVDVTGTPFTLHYQSDRVPGRQSTLKIFLSGDTIPETLKRIELEVRVAGRLFKYSSPYSFPTAPNQTYTFTWDGQDAYGRTVQGIQPVTVRLGYVYGVVYGQPAQAARSFALYASGTLAVLRPDIEFILWQTWTAAIGQWDARAQGLGGWSLNTQHAYAPLRQVLYLGNGQRRSAESLRPVIAPVAGTGTAGFSGDGGPATAAQLQTPWGITGSPDGSLYIADDGARRVRRVSPEGVISISTVAGTGEACFPTGSPCGDGGPATAAQFYAVRGVAVGPDGSLYIVDYARVRRVSPAGMITTVAGTGTLPGSGIPGFSGDGGPATAAQFSTFVGIAMGSDGSLYIADTFNARVRRVGPDGIITTVAGTGIRVSYGDGGPAIAAGFEQPLKVAVGPDGSLYIIDADRTRRVGPDGIITTVAGVGAFGFSGDGGLATLARLNQPQDVTVGPDGSLYIADFGNFRIRRVGPEGLITTLAGNGTSGGGGDGGPATAAQFSSLRGVAVGPDGSLYIADDANHRIRRVTAGLPGFAVSDFIIPSEDGQELYVFTSAGRHLRTLHALTGAVRFQFAYDTEGRLASVTDGDGNVTTVEHDSSGAPMAITGPFGQRTTLAVDANGYLTYITNPASETIALTSTSDGLLTSLTDPRGHMYQFTYDAQGLLTRDADPAGGFKALTRTDAGNPFTVDLSTALGRTTTYTVESLSTGDQRRLNTFPDGTQTEDLIGTNGSWKTTLADGTVTNFLQGPDPRFAMQAAIPKSLTTTTGGLTATLTTQRSVTLTDPNDPLSLTSQSNTVQLNGRTSTSMYDAATKTTTRTSAAGRKMTVTIDLQRRITQVQVAGLLPLSFSYNTHGRLANFTQGTEAETRTFIFIYNSNGHLDTVTDPLGHTAHFQYDTAGRVTRQTLPDGREILSTYDPNGNLTSLTPPGRPTHMFAYTPVDLIEKYAPPNIGAGTNNTLYTFNADRQLTHITHPDGETLTFDYNTAGRLGTLTLSRGQFVYTYSPTTGQRTSVTAPDGGTLTYTYTGALLTQTAWAGTVTGSVSRTYNSDFRVSSLSVNGGNPITLQYDADSLLTKAGDLTLSRAQNGLLTGSMLGSVTDTWGYNGFGESSTYSASYNATLLYTAQHSRDTLGRITGKTETIGGVTNTYSYSYDLAGRLAEVKQNGTNIASYTYDSNGNRLSVTGPAGAVVGSYDDQDRLTRYGSATYTYTANGELQSKTVGSQTTSYQYDVLGNLMAITLPNGTQIAYLVDGQNRRIGKQVNGTLVQGFLYQDKLRPIAELDGTNSLTSRFVYASRANVPDYLIKGEVTYRILTDHLGSPRFVLNTVTGQIVQRMDYDEWGNVTLDTNPGFQPFGFGGGIYDRDAGFVRFGARDYDPATGRWTAQDPVLFAGGQPNLYAYVGDDPINAADTSGLDGENDDRVLGRVVCDQNGNYEVLLLDDGEGELPAFLKECRERHEKSHIEDLIKSKANACYNKAPGTPVGMSDPKKRGESEIKAYKEEQQCLQRAQGPIDALSKDFKRLAKEWNNCSTQIDNEMKKLKELSEGPDQAGQPLRDGGVDGGVPQRP